jgi:bidirectional [NiFe] hydrogenase diaphorase subunit
MVNMILNGLPVKIEEGQTVLEAAKFFGFPIPTLCYLESLSPYGACRLCVVEVGEAGKSKLVTSCTFPVEEGLIVRTSSERVVKARKLIIELLLASCPQSKTIQDLASAQNIRQQRFRQEYEECILCGRCVRMCEEQMMAKAIGFQGRGEKRNLGTPFDKRSDVCRLCGGCIYVCPACQLRCTYSDPERVICGGCANLSPPCIEKEQFHDMMCYMEPCVACEIKKEN